MSYYITQLRLWWWQMRLEGAELERDRASALWHGADYEAKRASRGGPMNPPEPPRRVTGARNRL